MQRGERLVRVRIAVSPHPDAGRACNRSTSTSRFSSWLVSTAWGRMPAMAARFGFLVPRTRVTSSPGGWVHQSVAQPGQCLRAGRRHQLGQGRHQRHHSPGGPGHRDRVIEVVAQRRGHRAAGTRRMSASSWPAPHSAAGRSRRPAAQLEPWNPFSRNRLSSELREHTPMIESLRSQNSRMVALLDEAVAELDRHYAESMGKYLVSLSELGENNDIAAYFFTRRDAVGGLSPDALPVALRRLVVNRAGSAASHMTTPDNDEKTASAARISWLAPGRPGRSGRSTCGRSGGGARPPGCPV